MGTIVLRRGYPSSGPLIQRQRPTSTSIDFTRNSLCVCANAKFARTDSPRIVRYATFSGHGLSRSYVDVVVVTAGESLCPVRMIDVAGAARSDWTNLPSLHR